MRIAALILALVFCANLSFGSVRKVEISKTTQADSPIDFSVTITPARHESRHVLVEIVLPAGQKELADLWKIYLWVVKDKKTVLAAPLDLSYAKDKTITVRYYGDVDAASRCLIAIRCGKHAPLSETIYQIDVGSYMIGDPSVNALSIKSVDGTTLITTKDMMSYNWKSHTITLKPGVRERLSKKLVRDLVGGHPFEVSANGTTFYRGNFTSSYSSISLDTVVIDLHPIDKSLTEDQIRIELGYPSQQFFKGDDPRNVEGIREVLKKANKLNEGT